MSKLQELAISKISELSDMDVELLLVLIDRLRPSTGSIGSKISDDKMAAYEMLNKQVKSIQGYFPANFDADKELEETLATKYGSVG